MVTLQDCWSESANDHMVSTAGCSAEEYQYLRTLGYLWSPENQQPGSIPLHRCYWTRNGAPNHLVSVDPNCEGLTNEGIFGYALPDVSPGGATYSISGIVTGGGNLLAGVAVTLSGTSSGATTTDASGNYTFTGLVNGTYAITPSWPGYTFSPTNRSVTINGANVTGQTFTVTQAAATTCTYSINPTSQNFTSAAGNGSVNVTAGTGCAWTAASNAGWITVTGGASGSGNGTMNYSVTENTTGSQRQGTITIAGQTFTVTQAAASACAYSITPTSQNFTSAGGAGNVDITTGSTCSWTAVSNDAWIVVSRRAGSGTGSSSVGYTVYSNTTGSSRTGTITIAGQTHTVTQSADTQTCTYSISPTSQNFTSAAGNGSVNVTAGGGCAWTAASNAGWITVTGGASSSGSGTVYYSVTENTTGSQRQGTITIAGNTFTVTQAAASGGGCSYAISPADQTFNLRGGSGSVAVTAGAGCAWTATESLDWITITSGSSGTGSGTVSYAVALNRSGALRTGTITIAGQTFTVTQTSE